MSGITPGCDPSKSAVMDHIEVWLVRLQAADRQIEHAGSLLSPDERERADRFRFEEHRIRYILAHGVLRSLIPDYTRRPPHFVYGPWGKPSLAGDVLEFNLSHCGEYAAYAFSTSCPVGIDIETIRPAPEAMKIAREFFSTEEYTELAHAARDDAFLVLWTRKEACLKATGAGLGDALDMVRVSTDLDAAITTAAAADGRRWTVHTLRTADLVGAVAWEGGNRETQIHQAEASALLAQG